MDDRPTRTLPPDDEFDDDAPALDGALRAAFGMPSSTPPSVIAGLTGRDDSQGRVLLRDPAQSEEPVVRIDGAQGERPLLRGGRYQVLGEIARGGVGVVLKGRDVDLGRDLAMKFLRESFSGNSDLVQRFVEEAQIAGQLQHPGIVPVYDIGVDDSGRPYFTMKLVRGRTLSALLAERADLAADRPRFLRVFEQMCEAMAYAHSRDVIHRDLKPANVLVGAFGEVQIVDWGLAKVLRRGGVDDETAALDVARERERDEQLVATVRSGPHAAESQVGSVIGTPAYMPPEQALGQVDRMDERSDVFALGAILCEILTGAPPYRGTDTTKVTIQAARAELEDAYERLARCGADEALIDLARSCLTREHGARPRDASVVAQSVSGYLASVEERARKAEVEAASAQARAAAEHTSKRLTLLLAATVLLALTIGGSVYAWNRQAALDRSRQEDRRIQSALRDGEASLRAGEFDGALAAAKLADDVLREASDPRKELGEAAVSLRTRTETAQSKRALIERLETLRSEDVDDAADAEDAYRSAFASAGLDPASMSPDALVSAVGDDTELRQTVAFALDDWAMRRRYHNLGQAQVLVALANRLDADPWRRDLREAVARHDQDALHGLVGTIATSTLPPVSLDMFGMSLLYERDLETARAVLEAGFQRHPDDFFLNLHLAFVASRLPDAEAVEERHLFIAMALRPSSTTPSRMLAAYYERGGHTDEAERVRATALAQIDDAAQRAQFATVLEADKERAARRPERAPWLQGFGPGRLSPGSFDLTDREQRDRLRTWMTAGLERFDALKRGEVADGPLRPGRGERRDGADGAGGDAGDPDRPRGRRGGGLDRLGLTKLLESLRTSPLLAPVRDADALAKLDETERAAWTAVWERLAALAD